MLAVIFYLACVGLFVTLSLLGPIFVALLVGEVAEALRFGFYLLIGAFIFGGAVLALAGRLNRMPQIGKLLLLLIMWVGLPCAVAVPIYDMSDLSVVDSLFESFSGLTTTGSSTLNTVEIWPQSLLFWRVQLQWVGGFLALLTIILIMAPLGVGGLTTSSSSFAVGADLRASPDRLLVFGINLALIYATMTAVCFLFLFLNGTRAFYAVTLAMTATSTGGFLPFDTDLDQVVQPFGQLVIATFLIVGATSVFWHGMLMKGQWADARQHRESYSVLILVAVLTLVFVFLSVAATGVDGAPPALTIVQALLNSASLVATSGIQSQSGYFTLLPLVPILFIVLVGGSAFSTSGGIKHYRVGGMLVQSWSELDRLIYPNGVRPSHFGSERFDVELMKAIWGLFVVAILTIGFGTIFIAAGNVPFDAALTATLSNFATAGPVYNAGWAGPGIDPWPTYSTYSDPAKVALMIVMVLGRLEVIAVIGLFSARYWRSR